MIKDNIKAQQEVIANIDNIVSRGIQSQSSLGVQEFTLDIFEGMKVTATAEKMDVAVVPADRAINTIQNLAQLSNLAVSSLDIMNGTISTTDLHRLMERSSVQTLEQKFEYTSFYYKSEPTGWFYVGVTENVPPPPPSAIKIIPRS